MKLIEKLSRQFAQYLLRNGILADADEAEVCAYGYEHILADLLQTALLIVVGLTLNLWKPILLYVVFFGSLKRYIGGWHTRNHWQCLIVSTAICLLCVLISHILPWWFPLPVAVICSILVWRYAPIPHQHKPLTNEEMLSNRNHAKRVVIVQAVVLVLLVVSRPAISYALYGSCGQLMAVCSLVISFWERRGDDEGHGQ